MEWEQSQIIEPNKYYIPSSWLKIEYFEALNVLFRIENSLRIFVYIILKSEFKEKWLTQSISSDDDENSTIGAIAKRRYNQDSNYAYLGYSIKSPLLHLTSGELIRLITSDAYWKYFSKYFFGTREIMKNKLDEIGNVRNSLAHFRPIKKGDVELIKQNSFHALDLIENKMKVFFQCVYNVPTNTSEAWYKELSLISTKECSVSFKQSKDGVWIRLILSFTPILKMTKRSKKSVYYNTYKLRIENLLNEFQILFQKAICITENIPHFFATDVNDAKIIKEIAFTFKKDCLVEEYTKIKNDLNILFSKISEEVEQLLEDNLARGLFVDSLIIRAEDSNNIIYYSGESFRTEFSEKNPIEFWGDFDAISENFFSATNSYPWMPVEVSNDVLPF